MQRAFWTAWAVVFGLLFLLILVTKLTRLLPFAIIWLVVLGVGAVACLKARQAAIKDARHRRVNR